jgi:putative tricarboxylic transport membrane protein
MLCLYSPQLWFSTFKRWLVPSLAIGPRWPVFLRVLCVIAILASLWLAWELNHRAWDIVLSLLFGLFGVACLLLGWNRLILCFAFYYSTLLEQSLRQSLVISRNDFTMFFERPLSRIHIALAIGMLAIAFALWLRRVVKLRRATPAQPA